jgi:hypothetical protein
VQQTFVPLDERFSRRIENNENSKLKQDKALQ